ncbi:MAG: flagellar hook-basal body protein [Lachnospiraceae bacterium]|nr:flagellar hook-basal body protein [Lachnospiraceae bacterium]
MVKGLYTAHTGMINEMKRMDILTNNLANADTTAYKKEGTTSKTFADELAIKIKDTSSNGIAKNLGEISLVTHLGQVYTDYSSGSFKVTDNDMDFALDGKGFFAVSFTDKQGNTSIKYTRDGAFTVNTQGYLVTKDGDYVLNATGALNRDPNQANYIQVDPLVPVVVDEMGYIYQNDQIVGTLGIADIDNYDYIEKYGENLYNFLEGANVMASDAKVRQGVLETSNVNVVNEMVNMIAIQRAYEAGQKVITSIDTTLGLAVNLGKL